MLYIASALKSTAVTHSAYIPGFIPASQEQEESGDALLVAKGNALEVWRATVDGLVNVESARTEVWGMVVGLEWVGKEGQTPHVVVMTDHPLARLLLYRYQHPTTTNTSPSLLLTDSYTLTPTKFTAEFYTGLVADRERGMLVASLYSGVLGVFMVGDRAELVPDASVRRSQKKPVKARRMSQLAPKKAGKGKGKGNTGDGEDAIEGEEEEMMDVDDVEAERSDVLVFTKKQEIPIHIYNFLSLAFLAVPKPSNPSSSSIATASEAALAFLYVTPDYTIELAAKRLDPGTQQFTDVCAPIDVLSPPSVYAPPAVDPSLGAASTAGGRPDPSVIKEEFGIPGAAKLLPLPLPSKSVDEQMLGGVLVIGDEFSAAFTLRRAHQRSSSSLSMSASGSQSQSQSLSQSGAMFGDANSPENAKRRKGSAGGSLVPVVGNTGAATAVSQGGAGGKMVLARQWRVRQGFGEVSGATYVLGPTPFVLIGDRQGRLSVLTYPAGGNRATASLLGTVSPPSCISYLDAGYAFIGSESGDCQVLRLKIGSHADSGGADVSAGSKGKGKSLQLTGIREEPMDVDTIQHSGNSTTSYTVMDTWTNIAPVKDFCVVSEEGGAANSRASTQIVTASGQASGASVRIIRSGVGAEEMVSLEGLEDVAGFWPVQGLSAKTGSTAGVLVSTYEGSTLLRLSGTNQDDFDAEVIPAGSAVDYICDHPTLLAGNIADDTMIQITPSQVRLISCDTGRTLSTWSGLAAGEQVLLADFDGEHVVLGLAKAEVVVLKLEQGDDGLGLAVVDRRLLPTDLGTELACLTVVSRVQAKMGAGPCLIVGYWGSNKIYCLDLSTLTARSEALELPTACRSACVRSSATGLQLLVGLGDGGVLSHTIITEWTPAGDPSISFTNRKLLQVGSIPVYLSHHRSTDQVVAISDRTALLSEDSGRMSFAPMNVKGITWASHINLAGLGECLLTSNAEGLAFTRINSLKKLHVKKVSTEGFAPLGIAYDAASDYYGIVAVSEEIEQEYGDLVRSSSFLIMGNRDQKVVKAFDLESNEEPICLEIIKVHGSSYFALGTTFPEELDDSGISNKGYLRLIEMDRSDVKSSIPKPRVVAQWQAAGCVQDVKAVWDKVAIALDYGVDLLDFNSTAKDKNAALSKLSSWECASKAAFLSVQSLPLEEADSSDPSEYPNCRQRLHVGDSVKSVYVLERDSKGQLCDVARDYMQHWVVAMEELEADGGSVVISDLSYNVKTLTFETGKVHNAGAMAFHELITKFQRGFLNNVEPNNTAGHKPEVVFATSSGTIGIIADLGTKEASLLSELQLNMDGLVKGPSTDWKTYRAIHMEGTSKASPTAGFVDGDFVQKFLHIASQNDTDASDQILNGPNEFSRVGRSQVQQQDVEDDHSATAASSDDVAAILESLASMH
ncbi:hypothetical protein QFC22_000666 [Naganishia vaughanmartiniae]|uniref:Uncharacterized protein n=1 Tax=Naganishia vaughanmartiniae TaxID=1424756 RepID=A0ACC2XIQ6_9TREE|nr:hypothetical protein QFC22_000666 [Naganishia vaughanmartiniae]